MTDYNNQGKLSLVATPIGNMEDITIRAVKALSICDYIVCEDTRHTNALLQYHNIKNIDNSNKKLLTFHANSNDREIGKIIQYLSEGKHLCYVSDAGTPTISDPGVLLIQQIHLINKNNNISGLDNNIIIESLPGASALITAYSLAGAVGNSFVFYGFLPHKKGRETIIKTMLQSDKTGIIYESVHRINKLLEQFVKFENEMNIKKEYVICRELTKLYEETIIGDIQYCSDYFKNNIDKVRGEFVVIVK